MTETKWPNSFGKQENIGVQKTEDIELLKKQLAVAKKCIEYYANLQQGCMLNGEQLPITFIVGTNQVAKETLKLWNSETINKKPST